MKNAKARIKFLEVDAIKQQRKDKEHAYISLYELKFITCSQCKAMFNFCYALICFHNSDKEGEG
jgi:hypothetical protein